MGFFSKLFGSDKEDSTPFNPFQVDMHSHLFPGIDDGVDDHKESIEIISKLNALGYRKFIITPHIMMDFYRNTPGQIRDCCAKLQDVLHEQKIDVVVEPAAEYYLDEGFEKLLKNKDMLSFGKNYVLVETNYMHATQNFHDLIFKLKIEGYTPVLAHPERYVYMYDSFEKYEDIFSRDILFQVNLSSLVGYYSPDAKRIAEMLIKKKMVHFIGTDIHHTRHLKPLQDAMHTKAFRSLNELNLLNNSLL